MMKRARLRVKSSRWRSAKVMVKARMKNLGKDQLIFIFKA